jgi:hypothetical protein
LVISFLINDDRGNGTEAAYFGLNGEPIRNIGYK